MATAGHAWLHEAARVAGAVAVVGGLAWPIARPAAENLVNQTVDTKLKVLENKFDTLDTTTRALSTQQAVQQVQTQSLLKQSEETSGDIKELQRDIKSLLRALREQ